ncbi:MAG: prephenate dehydrogenase/arogenate dehydrogenase family protein [Capsulimonadales bacterium]|nr:prephenate dehydrogenase/arogenate dehydrogenase family protein [Capsulimonadales bacterium]
MPRPFSRIAIVGVGLIGGSLGLAVRERGLAAEVIGIGRNPVTLSEARELRAIDAFSLDLAEGTAGADLVVLATPIPQILADIERLAALADFQGIVTDVGSIKGEIAARGARFLPDRFIGSHPMAGSEKAGVRFASADLFVGATWVLTPTEGTPADRCERVRFLAGAIGARLLELSPDAHDRAVAVTSHLPHILAYALAAVAGDRAEAEPDLPAVAAGSFASGTRVAQSSPELWQGICSGNRAAVLEALRAYSAELDEVRRALESEDDTALLEAFDRGFQARNRWKSPAE